MGLVKSLLVTLLLATIPWWDLLPRWFKHQELCELDGGYREYNTVAEGVDSYYHAQYVSEKGLKWRLRDYRYEFVESSRRDNGGQPFRYSLNENDELVVEKIEQPVSRYEWLYEYLGEELPYNFTGTRSAIRDKKTGEIMASLTNYSLKRPWGWYFSFPDKGKGCIDQKLSGTEYFFTKVIPSKMIVIKGE